MTGSGGADEADRAGGFEGVQVAFGDDGRAAKSLSDVANLERNTLLHLGHGPALPFIQIDQWLGLLVIFVFVVVDSPSVFSPDLARSSAFAETSVPAVTSIP